MNIRRTRRPIKVMIPSFPSPDSFEENVAYTLRAMGHEVRMMEKLPLHRRSRIARSALTLLSKAYPRVWTEAERWVVGAAHEWKPDVIMCLTQSLKTEVLKELRTSGAKARVAWWGDAPANMSGMGLLSDEWDFIYIKDAAAVAKFRAVGFNAFLMHEAMNPAWHRPSSAARNDKVVVAGNYYGYRQVLVSRLLEASVPLALYGSPPPRWSADVIRENYTGRYITKHEKSSVFEAGLANLNCTSLSEGNSLNCRAFEICGAGGLQLIEDKPAVADCFEPGVEVLTYDSVDQILEYIGRARSDLNWANRIRRAGMNRASSEHTYQHRLRQILNNAGLTQ